jgi:hypothetical protein
MRKRLIGVIMTAALLLIVSAVQAQQVDRPVRISGRPNFNGVWTR